MGASAIVAYVMTNNLVNKAIPVDVNCNKLTEGIDSSLSAVPAYVIVGGENFKNQYEIARTQIDTALQELKTLSDTALNEADRKTFAQVQTDVESLEKVQTLLVLSLDNKNPDNASAESYVQTMQSVLTAMIEEESVMEATTQRKELLYELANSRGALAAGVGKIRTYLLTGDIQFKAQFEIQWKLNQEAFNEIESKKSNGDEIVGFRYLMTEQQEKQWVSYVQARQRFQPLLKQLFDLRVTADSITKNLAALKGSAETQRDIAGTAVKATLVVATLVAIGLGCLVALLLSRAISTTVHSLAERANEIAAGNLDGEPLAIRSEDELGQLATSFNAMATNLREMIGTMTSQEEMLKSEARAKAVFSAAADGLVTIDEHGIVQSFNTASEKLFGYTSDEVVGQNVKVLTPSPHREEHDNYIQRYLQTGDARIIGSGRELQGMRKDGSKFDILLRVVELRLDDERIFIGTISDITERRRTHAAIRDSVGRLATVMREILSTTTQQAMGAQQQATAVSQTVATVEEVRQIAEQANQRANEMAQTARRTGEVGEAGRKSVEDSVDAMNEVKEQVESIAENILSLAERAQAIREITSTVSDIAEQTNVLALNAAVEASRAGENGKGFAVVASEVKSLAEQSKKATVQVRQILGEIQQATNTAVLSTEQGTKAVTKAGSVVTLAGDTINTLIETLSESAHSAMLISAASTQQTTGVGQLNEAIQNIDKVTQENVQAIKQIEQSTHNMHSLSIELGSLTA
jgi:PAS domain S-box-containing protein